MQIQTNVALGHYSTMRLGGVAKALCEVHTKADLLDALQWADTHNATVLMLGGGSNVIFSDGYDGLVIVNRIGGFEVVSDSADTTIIKVGAGENWDGVVERTVRMDLTGIEKLSMIPGTAGATPVQNVGAYGAEIADVFVECEAYDVATHQFVTLDREECKFSYRNSIFKSVEHRHHIITSITLELIKEQPHPPFYASLQKYLDEHNITTYTPQTIRDAVMAIRSKILPDPVKVANTGSFFKNPIIGADKAAELIATYPDMPNYPQPSGEVKLPAGWLVDKAGLKGYSAHGMRIHDSHALVFINESAKTYDDLAAFKEEVIAKIYDLFEITLEQEPELL